MSKAKKSESEGYVGLIGFIALILALAGIFFVLIVWGFDTMSVWAEKRVEQKKKDYVGLCVDVSPLPLGKVVDYVPARNPQVKVLATDAMGHQSITYMHEWIALDSIVACPPISTSLRP
ncbi:hypothetical protein O9X98_10450 [Agrobacterium salinitolerans]|nr:hypothetical protein [Agrobacterium salinitolerans]